MALPVIHDELADAARWSESRFLAVLAFQIARCVVLKANQAVVLQIICLAIAIWSQELAKELPEGPAVISVNPGSLLATKMVKEGFGMAGQDLAIGAGILCKLALDPVYAHVSGDYFDNDAGRFSQPHSAALNAGHRADVMAVIHEMVSSLEDGA